MLTTMDRHVLTGSYHNFFRIYDTDTLSDVVLQADKSAFKVKKVGGPLPNNKGPTAKNGSRPLRDQMLTDTLDFNKKILHASWHPRENTIAVRKAVLYCGNLCDQHTNTQIAATNNLFLYSAA
jgi:serine/threonine-protein phosphatase 2A regulatory subunit B